MVPPCSTHAGRLSPPSARGVGTIPPRRANRGSRVTRERYASFLLALTPDDSRRTGSAEPRTTPFPPPPFMPQQGTRLARVTGSARRVTPHPLPLPLTRTECPNWGLQGVTATWETRRALPSAPHPHLRSGRAQSRGPTEMGPLFCARTVPPPPCHATGVQRRRRPHSGMDRERCANRGEWEGP